MNNSSRPNKLSSQEEMICGKLTATGKECQIETFGGVCRVHDRPRKTPQVRRSPKPISPPRAPRTPRKKVWMVEYVVGDEKGEFMGIFSTHEKAVDRVETFIKTYKLRGYIKSSAGIWKSKETDNHFFISEIEIDGIYPTWRERK